MQVNPVCPKCKNNKRVISSYKRVVFNPNRFQRFVISFYTKIINVCTRIVGKAMSAVNYIQRQRYLFHCNHCSKEFFGTQKQKVKK